MSEQMDFNDGKYTVISDNGRLTALRNGEPWNRDITGDNLIYWMLVEAIRLKEERDASAAKLAKVEGQLAAVERLRPMWAQGHSTDSVAAQVSAAALTSLWDLLGVGNQTSAVVKLKQLLCVSAEPVNARLLEALKAAEDYLCGITAWTKEQEDALSDSMSSAIAAAEAQQGEPVCLTCGGEGAIGGWRHGEGYDQEPCPDCTKQAVLAVTELAQSKPALMTIEQARNAERYAYLRSQHEGSVAASFAVFAPEQPIGEFGPVGSMPGELDSAIDAAIRANGYKVES